VWAPLAPAKPPRGSPRGAEAPVNLVSAPLSAAKPPGQPARSCFGWSWSVADPSERAGSQGDSARPLKSSLAQQSALDC